MPIGIVSSFEKSIGPIWECDSVTRRKAGFWAVRTRDGFASMNDTGEKVYSCKIRVKIYIQDCLNGLNFAISAVTSSSELQTDYYVFI